MQIFYRPSFAELSLLPCGQSAIDAQAAVADMSAVHEDECMSEMPPAIQRHGLQPANGRLFPL